jgi:hypothetical protein
MISESDVSQYRKRPVRVKCTDGDTFDGTYIGWQLDVADEVPDAMLFYPLDGRDLCGGWISIEASEIVSVTPLDDETDEA